MSKWTHSQAQFLISEKSFAYMQPSGAISQQQLKQLSAKVQILQNIFHK